MQKILITVMFSVCVTILIQDYVTHSNKFRYKLKVSDWIQFRHNDGNIEDTTSARGLNARYKHDRKLGAHKRKCYLIYSCSKRCGGWTDRLKGIVTGYILANITDRTFGINITNLPCELNKVVIPNQINWNLNLTNKQLSKMQKMSYRQIDSLDFYKNVQYIDFRKKFPAHKKIIQFSANLDYIDQFKQNKFHEKDLYWLRNMSRDQVYNKILKLLLRLSPESQSRLDEFMNRAKPEKQSKLICAHIRRGKSDTIPSDPVRATKKDVVNSWEFLSAYNDSSIYKIFVATDSEAVYKEAKKRFPIQIVENAGNIIHVDKKKKHQIHTCDDFRKVIIDQQILSRCDVLLISFSGFSRYAAYMRNTDKGLYCILRDHSEIQKCKIKSLKELYGVMG